MAGLTDRQKKNLPPALRKAIVKKMEKEEKLLQKNQKLWILYLLIWKHS